MIRRAPRSTLLPCTTLFRSLRGREVACSPRGGASGRRTPGGGRSAARDGSEGGRDARRASASGGGCRPGRGAPVVGEVVRQDRKSTRLNSSHANLSYAVLCL